MNGKYILQILGSTAEINSFHDYKTHKKIAAFHIDLFNYGLLVYTAEERLITFLKLSVKDFVYDDLELISDGNFDQQAFKINLLNVFSLPFVLLKIIFTNNNMWAIGQHSALDLKPHIESVLQKVTLEDDDKCMDIDEDNEFHYETFVISINMHQLHKCDLNFKDIFIDCNSLTCGVIRCQKNLNLNVWQLERILLNDQNTKSSDVTMLSFLDFPLSFNKGNTHSYQGQTDTCDPVVFFIHHNDPESHTFRDIFGINCSSSDILCLVGHPDGKVLWALCDYTNQFQSSHNLQILYDIKQPVIGIYFLNNIEEFEGYGCMLVVGALGQITLFSSKKHPSLSLVPGQHPFWIMCAYLKSSITNCTVVKDCLFHLSNRTVWITDLSTLLSAKGKTDELCLASNSSELCSIEQMIVVNKSQGLILFLTSSGNIYLTVCKKKLDPDVITSSLPSLMNECLQQSTVMQELLNKKVLQNRFFTTVSAFASLKFCGNTLKESITFSISEVNLEPKKYILSINFKCFEKLHLDSELCHVTATVFTYFKKNFSLVTKITSYITDTPMCIELTDTVLQPPFVTIFPLFVEVGLILQLPDSWNLIDCFKPIANCLPFYLRVQTFMVHELHLFQSNVLCAAKSFRYEKPKAAKIIQELAMKRPISNILGMKFKKEYQLPTQFNLCLSASSLKEMMKNFADCDPCEFVKNILFLNKHSNCLSEETHSAMKKSPISVEITNQNDNLAISLTASSFDSLIGLRVAVMDILLAAHNQNTHITSPSTFVSIPASIYKRCQDISTSLRNLYGKDVESDEITDAIMQLYK